MAKKADKLNPEVIKAGEPRANVPAGRDWKAEGITTAKALVDLEKGVDGRRLDLVFKEAEALSGNKESITAFMEGVGQALIEAYGKETAKFRKGEIKAIVEAWSIDKAKVNSCKGWHEAVKVSRALRPSTSRATGEREKVKLTDRQAEQVKELVEHADASQTHTVAHNAVLHLGKLNTSPLVFLNLARESVHRITGTGNIPSLVSKIESLMEELADAIKADSTNKAQAEEQGKKMAEEQSEAGNKMLKAA